MHFLNLKGTVIELFGTEVHLAALSKNRQLILDLPVSAVHAVHNFV